jgi:hypothetical protein
MFHGTTDNMDDMVATFNEITDTSAKQMEIWLFQGYRVAQLEVNRAFNNRKISLTEITVRNLSDQATAEVIHNIVMESEDLPYPKNIISVRWCAFGEKHNVHILVNSKSKAKSIVISQFLSRTLQAECSSTEL